MVRLPLHISTFWGTLADVWTCFRSFFVANSSLGGDTDSAVRGVALSNLCSARGRNNNAPTANSEGPELQRPFHYREV